MTWFIVASCRVIAASSTGWPCPWIAVHHELIASSTSTGRPRVDDRQRGAARRDRHHRRQRVGADRAVRMPDVGGVDGADLVGRQRRASGIHPSRPSPSAPSQNATSPARSVDCPSTMLTLSPARTVPATESGADQRALMGTRTSGLLPARPRRPARRRDRAGRGVPHLVRQGLRRRRRVPRAVRVLLRRPAAAHRADPRFVAVTGARGQAAGPAAAARAGRGARRVGGADDPDPARDALGDLRRPEPGQPRLLPELGAGRTPRRTTCAPARPSARCSTSGRCRCRASSTSRSSRWSSGSPSCSASACARTPGSR